MAPKKITKRGEELKQEDVLQAVVIADSFDRKFVPISDKRPRSLFHVANVPLLDYTLEFLCSAGVEEVFVFCCHLADQIKDHLKNSGWIDNDRKFFVQTITSEDCMSVGDALRDIDAKSLIRSDFILVHGDVVSNINIQDVVQEHKKRRETDKSSIMTQVFTKAPPTHASRCREDDLVVAIDSKTSQIIHYQKVDPDKNLEFPVEILTEHKEVQIRYDLLDCQISVCSPQVLSLFTDNFDYQSRDDFIKGILTNEEIMGNTIYIRIITEKYAARISNLQLYDSVSRDIINRWTFPMVPDNCIKPNKDSMSYGRHNVYLSKDVTLARGCVLEENVLVGKGSVIGSNSFISNTVIGSNCKIGENVKLIDTYVWDGVTVENNCVINKSLLCDNVTVYEGVTVCSRCVLSWDVAVGPQVTMKEGTVAVASLDDDDFGEIDDRGTVSTEFGVKGRAFHHSSGAGSDEEDEKLNQAMWGLSIEYTSDDDDESSVSTLSSAKDVQMASEEMFYIELQDTLKRGKDENISADNLIVEINSLKLAYNITVQELNIMVTKALLEQSISEAASQLASQVFPLMKMNLQKFLSLLKNYIKSADSQKHCLQSIEEFGSLSSLNLQLVVKVIHILYDLEVLDEQVILKWYKQGSTSAEIVPDKQREIRQQVEPLIKWLEEADEESSESEG
ncbi:hypothetical protein CHS0354_021193 [Potamilus streckersoni]|uniref:Translation initiation factor eIF2B subunit epsilon n=1 Tax=Potamilus streckersoni TaxID=2493646 RepID=A0AAE0W1R3_9BIVA|nr:hypothetical protein CHS0354_021193 [Potamilus streckersoni]